MNLSLIVNDSESEKCVRSLADLLMLFEICLVSGFGLLFEIWSADLLMLFEIWSADLLMQLGC